MAKKKTVPDKYKNVNLTPQAEDFISDSTHIQEQDVRIRRTYYKQAVYEENDDKGHKKGEPIFKDEAKKIPVFSNEVDRVVFGRTEEEEREHADANLRSLITTDSDGDLQTTDLADELTNTIADMMGRDRDAIVIDFEPNDWGRRDLITDQPKYVISIKDNTYRKVGEATPDEDILDIDMSKYDLGNLLRRTVLEMGLVNQELANVETVNGMSVKEIRDITGNSYLNIDTHIGQFKENNFGHLEAKPDIVARGTQRSWQGYRNSYGWLVEGTEFMIDVENYFKGKNRTLADYDTPAFWFQIAEYVNDTAEDTSNFNSEDYELGDFFSYLRSKHIHTTDITSEELEELYQAWREGNDKGYLEDLRAKNPNAVRVEINEGEDATDTLNRIVGDIRYDIRVKTTNEILAQRTSATNAVINRRGNMIPGKVGRSKKPK